MDQSKYEFKQNNFTNSIKQFYNNFWYKYVNHPNSSENIKNFFNEYLNKK